MGKWIVGLLLACLVPAAAEDAGREITLTVEEAIQAALSSSASLRSGRYETALMTERYRLGLRRYFPSLRVGLSESDSVVYHGADSRTKRLSVSVSQVVFDRFARDHHRQAERNAILLKTEAQKEAELELASGVVALVIRSLAHKDRRTILESAKRNADTQLSIAKEELALGKITEVEYLSIGLEVKDLDLRLAASLRDERRTAFDLSRVLGFDKEARLVVGGRFNTDYEGFLEKAEPSWFALRARAVSFEAKSRLASLQDLRNNLRREELSGLPEVKTTVELSASGREYPLSEPGFNLGVELSFPLPTTPVHIGGSIGRSSPTARSRSISASLSPAEDLDSLTSETAARIALDKAAAELRDFETRLDFEVRERLDLVSHQRRRLDLLREKEHIAGRRRAVQLLMLEVGDLTRLDFLKSEVERAQLQIEILDAVAALYQEEIAIMRLCGLPGIEESHRRLILEEALP